MVHESPNLITNPHPFDIQAAQSGGEHIDQNNDHYTSSEQTVFQMNSDSGAEISLYKNITCKSVL